MAEKGYWMLYVLREKAFIPTMARTQAGFYVGIEPVEVVDVRDQVGLEQALLRAVHRGNPSVRTPSRDNFPKSVLLERTKLRSLKSLDRLGKSWRLSKKPSGYSIAPYRPLPEGGAVEDLEHEETIPVEAPLEKIVRRLLSRALESEEK
jgi:hypothetical protein